MSGFNRKLTTSVETVSSVAMAQRGSLLPGVEYAFPQDISAEFCFGIMTKKFKHDKNGRRSDVVGSHYVLPLPTSIQDTQGVNYNTPKPGAVIAGLAEVGMNVAGEMMNAADNRAAGAVIGKTLKGLAKNVKDAIAKYKTQDAISALQLGMQAVGAGSSYVVGAGGAMMGEVPNPSITAFFEGVQLRNHSFQWDLYPQSRDESATLHNMIRSIRRDSLPARPLKPLIKDFSASRGGLGVDVSPFLTYPLEAHITITTMGAQNTIRFKPAFIESISVNYSPGGVAFLQNGQPAGIQLGLTFKEVDIHTREDYVGEELITESQDEALTMHLVE